MLEVEPTGPCDRTATGSGRNCHKPSTAPLRKHSLGGYTSDRALFIHTAFVRYAPTQWFNRHSGDTLLQRWFSIGLYAIQLTAST